MNKNPNLRHIIALAVVMCLGMGLLFTLILKESNVFRGLSMSKMPGHRLSYDSNGVALPHDPAFILMRPLEVARVPTATRFDPPLGSEHAAFTHVAWPYPEHGMFLPTVGEDHNGIGGMDTDQGDPVYAVAAGRVIYSGDAKGEWGNVIILAHRLPDGSEIQSVYGHLERRYAICRTNVRRGEEIGTVGKGNGKHPAQLHLVMRSSHSPNPGRWRPRSTVALNRIDPAKMIAENRNAPADLLNPSPKIIRSTEFFTPPPPMPTPPDAE